MGTIEKKLEGKMKTNILDIALSIVRRYGWQALSMRKIANEIKYTTPIIYKYFKSKDEMLEELTRVGFIRLSLKMKHAVDNSVGQNKMFERVCLAYWNFAFEEKELYQLMFGIEISSCKNPVNIEESALPVRIMTTVIRESMLSKEHTEEGILASFYSCWSMIHGLIAINFIRNGISPELNHQILSSVMKLAHDRNRSIKQ